MNTNDESKPLPECHLPAPLAHIATAFGYRYGVPPATVATVALNLLGGILSAALRIRFQGHLHPLGFHTAVIEAVVPESAPFEDELLAPITEEVERLRELEKKMPEARKRYDQAVKDVECAISSVSQQAQALLRELGPIAYPDFLLRGLPTNDVRDGLGAPICMIDLRAFSAGQLRAIAATHSDVPGRTLTVWAKVTEEEARAIAGTPLLRTSLGWPLVILPTANGRLKEVVHDDLIAAREAWTKLVKHALSVRYDRLSEILISAEAYADLTLAKGAAEKIAAESKSTVGAVSMLSTLLRCGSTLHVITAGAGSSVPPEILRDVMPLAKWVSEVGAQYGQKDQPPLFAQRGSKKATLETDLAKVRRVIEKHPNLSDREIRRKLPNRARGHWSLLIRSVRGDFKPDFAAKYAAIAAGSSAAN